MGGIRVFVLGFSSWVARIVWGAGHASDRLMAGDSEFCNDNVVRPGTVQILVMKWLL